MDKIKKRYDIAESLENMQPTEMVEYLKGLSLGFKDISWFLINRSFCQTQEMVNFFKSLNPDVWSVVWLIAGCPFCQTPEMLEYFKSLKPDAYDASWLIRNCKFCQTQEMLEYLKSLEPDKEDIVFLIKNCDFCQIAFSILEDANGVKVKEGDIVCFLNEAGVKKYAVIESNGHDFWFSKEVGDFTAFEIIGNKYI